MAPRSTVPVSGSTTVLASWGCTPAVAHTESWRWAAATQARDDGTSQPTVINRVTPTAAASDTTAASASRSSGRWQWLSVHRIGSVTGPSPEPSTSTTGSCLGVDAGDERLALDDGEPTRVAAPGRSGGQPLVGGVA